MLKAPKKRAKNNDKTQEKKTEHRIFVMVCCLCCVCLLSPFWGIFCIRGAKAIANIHSKDNTPWPKSGVPGISLACFCVFWVDFGRRFEPVFEAVFGADDGHGCQNILKDTKR